LETLTLAKYWNESNSFGIQTEEIGTGLGNKLHIKINQQEIEISVWHLNPMFKVQLILTTKLK
jgi:hypothetical protein